MVCIREAPQRQLKDVYPARRVKLMLRPCMEQSLPQRDNRACYSNSTAIERLYHCYVYGLSTCQTSCLLPARRSTL